jgi:SAM-dependent methyltransferase
MTEENTAFNYYIESQSYKNELGGGSAMWDSRGEFQIYLLQQCGLKPDHNFLDIGCGPIRGGEYFIRYLNEEKYTGIDKQLRYIKVSENIVNNSKDLLDKKPLLKNLNSFSFEKDFFNNKLYDFMFAFAVFKTTSVEQIIKLLLDIEPHLNGGGKIVFTHLRCCIKNNLVLTPYLESKFKLNLFKRAEEFLNYFSKDFRDPSLWPYGINGAPEIFPIMVLEKMN